VFLNFALSLSNYPLLFTAKYIPIGLKSKKQPKVLSLNRLYLPLTGELVARRRGPGDVARLTPGLVAQLGHPGPAAVRRDRRAAQVIAQQEIQRAALFAHGHPLTARVVILDHRARAARPFEGVADVVGGHDVQHGFDAVAVPSPVLTLFENTFQEIVFFIYERHQPVFVIWHSCSFAYHSKCRSIINCFQYHET
jgi:hypothetical protein